MKTNTHTAQQLPQMSGKMKVAALIDLNYRLLGVLTRLGMKLGFGESTVSDLCNRYNVDETTFLLLCRVYTFKGYRPSDDILDRINAEDLLKYLKLSHKWYTDTALTTLEEHLQRILSRGQDRSREIIWEFFSGYKRELERHFEFEEQNVFPYVKTLAANRTSRHDALSDVHGDIDEKIDDLKNIVMKYLPDDCDGGEVMETVSFIYNLRDDLLRHESIEDNVLMPLIRRMEGSAK